MKEQSINARWRTPEVLGARLPPLSAGLAAITLIAMTIAAIGPFDIVLARLSLGVPALAAVLTAALALVGARCAGRIGLRLDGHGARSPALVGAGAAVAMALYVIALDLAVLRPLLPAGTVHFLQAPLVPRLAYFMIRAFNENVLYRLFLFPVLALALTRGRAAPTLPQLIAAMVAAQLFNIGVNVAALSPEPLGPARLLYDGLRYIVPGVVWAELFRRHGFATAEIASVGCHVVLQPLFSLLL